MIIVFGNKKGGCGKSVTLMNLAGVFANRGEKVCIIDADTNETCNNYIRRREKTNNDLIESGKAELQFIKVEVRRPDDKLVRDLREMDKIYDRILVDTGGYENNAFKSAITVADMVYMPFQACQADMEQIKPTLAVIKGVEDYIQGSIDENYEIDCRLIVTLAESRAKDMMIEARNAARTLVDQVSISNSVISYCKEVRKVQDRGLTLSDPVFSGNKAHPRRAMYELLADEVIGKNKVKFPRIRKNIANTQAAGLAKGA